MAEHGALEVGTATGVDYQDHQRTYRSFLRVTRWAIAVIAILLIVLAWLHG
jgi:aa3 type cytochrome c oxidase subunit IV